MYPKTSLLPKNFLVNMQNGFKNNFLLLFVNLLKQLYVYYSVFTPIQCPIVWEYRTSFICTVLYMYCTILYMYCTVRTVLVLYCTVLYCTVLFYTVLYCAEMYFTVLYCTELCWTVLYCTVLVLYWKRNVGVWVVRENWVQQYTKFSWNTNISGTYHRKIFGCSQNLINLLFLEIFFLTIAQILS
jgi:hypothetical protein